MGATHPRRNVLLAGAVASAAPFPALACRMLPGASVERYTAWSDAQRVGQLEFRFERAAGALVVSVRMRLSLPGAPGGSGAHALDAREEWRGGELRALDSAARTGGSVRRVRGRRERHGFRVHSEFFVHSLLISGYFVTSTFWHRDARLVAGFLDVGDGLLKRVSVRGGGREVVRARGRDTPATRYTYRGELNREAWYDDDCVLVRMDLRARKTAGVELQLDA